MKYAIFVAKTLILFIFQLLITLVGMVLIPFFLKRTEAFECEHEESIPSIRFKDRWFDAIFGNCEDGLDGDAPYKAKYNGILNLWTRYNWVAFRNPIHNLALKMGVNEVITSYSWKGNRYTEDRVGHEGWCYSEATGESGTVYQMFRWCKLWFGSYGIEMNIGYKNFNITEVGKKYTYSFTVSINPFKKFEL
jgi:hypothetical protein